jgi:hypothetical protein
MELPTLSSFPVGVPIPVAVIIRTRTKPMSKSDVSEESLSSSAKKPLSPAPPRDTTGVQFWLDTHHGLTAAPKSSSVSVAITVVEQRVHPLGGFAGSSSSHISVSEEKPVWIPNSEQHHETGKGRWQRGTRFESMITLACSPTTDFGIIKSAVSYRLRLRYQLKLSHRETCNLVHATPGSALLRHGQQPSSQGADPRQLWGTTPSFWCTTAFRVRSSTVSFNQTFSLCNRADGPSRVYFTGKHHEWDADEKSGS